MRRFTAFVSLAALALACGPEAGAPPPRGAQEAPPPRAARQAPPPRAAREAPRSVLLITVDTLRADALGAYTPGLATSPVFDALAAEGWLFLQADSTGPSTLPSHASILTGRDPFAHGVRSNAGYALNASELTLAEVFTAAGYRTGAEVAAAVIARRTGLDQGFEHYRDTDASDARRKRVAQLGGAGQVVRERPAEDISDRGIEFLRSHAGEPFFLWLHYFDPHAQYAAPPEYARRFPDRAYHAEVAYTDAQIGRVIEELRSLGLAERTLVALTSDHGEGLGDHDEVTHSFLAYQSTLHVPLLFWGPPDLPRGERVSEPVRTIDIAPTLLAWAGLPPLPDARGVALQERGDEPREAYAETFEARAAFGASSLRSLRRGDWKYLHKSRPELYQLVRDPGERNDLAREQPERVAELRQALAELLASAPEAPADSTVELEPEVAAQLAALGYAAAPAAVPPGESLELEGADPRELLDDFLRLGEAALAATQRDPARAADLYAELAAEHPDGVLVLRGWIDALRHLERWSEQLPLLERAVALAPDDNALRIKWVESLEATGNLEEAARQARIAHAARPCGELEIAYLSRVLRANRHFEAQRDALQHSLERCRSDGARNELAWLLATSPDPSLRDGAKAVALARELASRPGTRPEFLDTLGAALAESGDFQEAARVQRRALGQLEAQDAHPAVLAVFREHLELFESGRELRDPPE